MSIASRITEIETHIGDVYDTIDYSYDTTGVNKNIINIPKYLKKGYIDIINNGIDTLYNNFPKVSGIGSNLSLTPTYEAPMKLNEIQGDTLQDGTPTPNTPVPIQSVTGLQNVEVCGKNLLKNQGINQTINGITFTKNEDGSITASGTATATAFYNMSEFTLPAGTYNISQGFQGTSGYYLQLVERVSGTPVIANISSRTNRTFTLLEQKNLRVNFRIANGTTIDNLIAFPMIEQGSTATEYEPYKSNTYEVNLGKNLFDINGTFTGNLIKYNNGFQLIKNSTNRTINYFPSSPIPKGTYTLSYEIVSSTLSDITKCIVQAFNSSNTPIATKQFSNDGYVTFTTTGDITKIYFYISNTETDDTQITLDNIQLEKGTQSTSFSPYFTPIELNKISTYKDSIKKSTGKNLFDKDNTSITSGAYINSSTGEIISGGTSSVINNISVISDTTYTLTAVGKNKIAFYDSNNNYLSNITSNLTTFTTPANCKYIKIQLATETLDINTIQLEKGSTATTYEPYGKVWYIEKQIGKVVLDGSENGFLISSNDNGYLFGISSKTFPLENYSTNYISNYSLANSTSISTTANIGSYIYNNIFRMRVPSTIATTFDNFKTWLSTHNTEVLYVLATPTTTEITNTELIEDLETLYTAKSQEGTTNISITSEDLEMILNVSALKGEV